MKESEATEWPLWLHILVFCPRLMESMRRSFKALKSISKILQAKILENEIRVEWFVPKLQESILIFSKPELRRSKRLMMS